MTVMHELLAPEDPQLEGSFGQDPNLPNDAAGISYFDVERYFMGPEFLPDPTNVYGLSSRELEIIQDLVWHGGTYADVGARLHFARKTIKNQISEVNHKTRTSNRTDAVVALLRSGDVALFSPETETEYLDNRLPLTEGEKTILQSIVRFGGKNADIADRLHIKEGTVKSMLYEIYNKQYTTNRLEAVLTALRSGDIFLNDTYQ